MNYQELLQTYTNQSFIQEFNKKLKGNPVLKSHLKGLKGSSKSVIASSLYASNTMNQLVILSNQEEARYFKTDMQSFLEEKHIHLFPAPYKKDQPLYDHDNAAILERTEVLNTIQHGSSKGHIIITYPEALCEKVISKEQLQKNTFELKKGDQLDLDFIIDFLVSYGFERTDFVFEAGTFSIRGGIVDVFSFANEKPFRIELFEDEVESIRMFEPETQLSIKKLSAVTLIPNMEEHESTTTLVPFLDYLPSDTMLLYTDLAYVQEVVDKFRNEAIEAHQGALANFEVNPAELFDESQTLIQKMERFPGVDIGTKPWFKADHHVNLNITPQPPFNKNFELLSQTLRKNTEEGYQNLIFSESSKQIERINAIFEDRQEEVAFTPVYNTLHEGFVDKDLKIACFTEHQIFNRFHRYKTNEYYKGKQALTLKELRELHPGDFITHVDHGIGVYRGLTKIENNGEPQEAVRLEYKGGDLLYVNIHSLHKISRYKGQEGKKPTLNKLGTNKWANTKQKTKNKVKDIARDLIKLYAQRKASKGHQFAPDTYLQTQMEASFLYEDTPDQAQATEDVKRDMESESPMDRLICGDVGFGKTEIAMRAAFKAVTEGKQVAILVPTTVLSLQHYKSFIERFSDFPVNVEYISRFRSTHQQKQILEKLKTGEVDIIIGTHRLTGKDIKMKDLGLLIIDEEQKFGVSAKEKLRAIKADVDTLTMTATPIPRTLQFSLMGARDFSIINTPPPNRQPVETHVEEFHQETIRQAIEHEIERNGQVFFVHNRVKDIYEVHETLKSLVPQANIAVAHGQMEGKQLEEVMLNFVDGLYDVLLSTSIVENGLDISNANTMIINQAQNFGLSDLYQLRGRVGRSNTKAYTYLLTPPKSVLTKDATRRLSALEEFTDLGSGFNIAMRDLDIRGAGNLLGAEQSGFITEVGFDMYQKILDEAIQELKHNEFKDLFKDEQKHEPELSSKDCQIDTDLSIMIPDHYVTNIDERMNLYQELNKLSSEEALQQFREKLEDRFGPIPKATDELLDTIRLKWKAMEMGIQKLLLKNHKLKATFIGSEGNNDFYQSDKFGALLQYVQQHPQQCRFDEKPEGLRLTIKDIPNIQEALKTLNHIAQEMLPSEKTEAET